MSLSVLITQCLQRDFVEPIERHEPLPNRLHVGWQEAARLAGEDPDTGPVAQLLTWAQGKDRADLGLVHVLDWHDPADPRQARHLEHFGPHCLKDTRGATLVAGLVPGVGEHIVHSIALNDFEGTRMSEVLDQLREQSDDGTLRVGVVGVWTEAKVTFLLYDLATRCGIEHLATCSALTASASRTQHFNALSQLRKLLGVQVLDGVGEFTEWLLPGTDGPTLPPLPEGFGPAVTIGDGSVLASPDAAIVAHLFRESHQVALRPIGGGFSGADVFLASSRDAEGLDEAPSVVKLDARAAITRERVAFERLEPVLGNDAPRLRAFAEVGERAGMKYAYAAMGQGGVRTLESLIVGGAPEAEILTVLDRLFGDILGRFSVAAQYEPLPLFEHYTFASSQSVYVRRALESMGVEPADAADLLDFYETFLDEWPGGRNEFHYVAYGHGDLNGANALIDQRDNVWLIDYMHAGRIHALRDLAKFENDLLYIMTPIADEAALTEARALTQALVAVEDLRAPVPEVPIGVTRPELLRSWRILRKLRQYGAEAVRSDRNPLQLSVALLRYSAHTLSFDQPTALQKRWALFAANAWAERVSATRRAELRLRVDWVDSAALALPGRLGMTICPGRRDWGRDLSADVATLAGLGAHRVVSLLTDQELNRVGAGDLREKLTAAGIAHTALPIADQSVPTQEEAHSLVVRIREQLADGDRVVLHCMGGLGRTGTLAACVLVASGLPPADAITRVREDRDTRAVETSRQESFVVGYDLLYSAPL